MVDEKILKDIEEAKILSIFKNIYNDYSNYKEKNALRNMLSISPDKLTTLKQMIKRKYLNMLEMNLAIIYKCYARNVMKKRVIA